LIDIDELPLVADIFADQILASRVGVPPSICCPYEYRLCVRPEALELPRTSFGDCDALVIETGTPCRASAVQFKRVKVSASSFRTGLLNKLGEFPKAVRQANELHAAGFANVWLTILVVTDLRSLSDASSRRFTPRSMMEEVISAIPLPELARDIGVTVCEITQVSNTPMAWRGGSGGTLVQSITERTQPLPLTDAITGLFSGAPAS
jgi:hypothetical protein